MTEKLNDEIMDERYYAQEIFDLVRKTPDKKKLANALSYYHDNDIASALSYLTPKERKHLYDSIGIENTSRVFAYLDEDVDKYFAELEAEQAADIIEEMDADDAVDILEGLNDTKAREIIKNLEPEAKEESEADESKPASPRPMSARAQQLKEGKFSSEPREPREKRPAKRGAKKREELNENVSNFIFTDENATEEEPTAMEIAWRFAMEKAKSRKGSDDKKKKSSNAEQDEIIARTLNNKVG